MNEPTNADLMRELRRLREDVEQLRQEVRRKAGEELVRVSVLADELGCSKRTIRRRMDQEGIPKRDMHGRPASGGQMTYVSRSEWGEAQELDTQTVRHRAGEYDD
jgi:DeoR/GlpR family transcriptional regulator of sugar metabolism